MAEAVELGCLALGANGLFPADAPAPALWGTYPDSVGRTPQQLSNEAELEAYLQRVALCALYADFSLRPVGVVNNAAEREMAEVGKKRPEPILISADEGNQEEESKSAAAPPLTRWPPSWERDSRAAAVLEEGDEPTGRVSFEPEAPVEVCLPASPDVRLAADPGDVLQTEETVVVLSITEDGKRALRKTLRNTWSSEVLKR